MRFSACIRHQLDAIIDQWETFAGALLPSAETVSPRALRDPCRQFLLAVAGDMETRESDAERATKPKGLATRVAVPETAAAVHGTLRHLSGFDLVQLVAEFRAMWASGLLLWQRVPNGKREAGERSTTSRGLGLFIVRDSVREMAVGHGAGVGVESSAEHGTRFCVRLPRATAAAMDTA